MFKRGHIPWNIGIPRTEEQKKAHSLKLTGRIKTPEEKEKHRKAMIGHPVSAETREKLRIASTGRIKTPEVIAAIKLGIKNGKKPDRTKYVCSEETKQKIREKRKLQVMIPWSEESRKKASIAKTGLKYSEDHRKNIGIASTGRPCSKETRKKLSDAHRGSKSYLWKGGITFDIYPEEFSRQLKSEIRDRDNHICQMCGKTEEANTKMLAVHHIDYNKYNCVPENLISLCMSCHTKTNEHREKWKQFFKDNYGTPNNTNISSGAKQNIRGEIKPASGDTEVGSSEQSKPSC